MAKVLYQGSHGVCLVWSYLRLLRVRVGDFAASLSIVFRGKKREVVSCFMSPFNQVCIFCTLTELILNFVNLI